MKQKFQEITEYLTNLLQEAIVEYPNDSISSLISSFLDDEKYIELKHEINDSFTWDQNIWYTNTPLEIARLFIDIECGQIAFWILNDDFSFEKGKLEEVYNKGQEAKKILYSLLPGAVIDEKILPKELQLDPIVVLENHKRKEEFYEKMFKDAKEYMDRTGEGVYHPFGKPESGDWDDTF